MFANSLKEKLQYKRSFIGERKSISIKNQTILLDNRSEIICYEPSKVLLQPSPTLSEKSSLDNYREYYQDSATEYKANSDGYNAKWCCFLCLIGVLVLCKL